MTAIKSKILITGASGLIGRALSKKLCEQGRQLVILGRKSETEFRRSFPLPCEYYCWPTPTLSAPPRQSLEVEAVIHLMGEPIADRRWNDQVKKTIQESRTLSTQLLVGELQKQNPQLKTFISSSAIGIYGDRGNELLNETSSPGNDFLSELCTQWEVAAQKAPGRSVQIRTPVVLSSQGGALAKMLPVFKLGLGGKLGSGKQWMSWIHLEDLVEIFLFALNHQELSGPINATSPQPLTNEEFTQTLAKALNTKAPFFVPKTALRLAMGEGAIILLASQRVAPLTLKSHSFQWKFPTLKKAFAHLFNNTKV